MSKEEVERFLIKGGEEKEFRLAYNRIEDMADFVEAATKDGFDFTDKELLEVIRENGDSFESYGNPRARNIWWYY